MRGSGGVLDYVLRLIGVPGVVLVVMTLAVSDATAQTTKPATQIGRYAAALPWTASWIQACTDYKNHLNATVSPNHIVGTYPTSWHERCGIYQGSAYHTVPAEVRWSCDGVTPNNPQSSVCYVEDEEDCPASGTPAGSIEYLVGWRTGPSANAAYAVGPVMPQPYGGGCVSGCAVTYDGGNPRWWVHDEPGANGYYGTGFDVDAIYTGSECESGDYAHTPPAEPSIPPPDTPGRCPRGTAQMGIDSDGIPVCVGTQPKASSDKTTSTSVTENPDGSTTTTTTETTTNRDGSTTTKTTITTTQPDGSSSTSSTTTIGDTPDGKPGTDDSSDEERGDLCKQYPHLTICQNSEISGTCGEVSCKGDAIQCAIAREVAQRNCQAKQDREAVLASAQHELGQALLDGNDPLATTLPSRANSETVAMAALSDAGWLGAGACFADKSFSIQGNTITIPFSAACDYLIVFRYVIMIIAAWLSFGLVSGAILRG